MEELKNVQNDEYEKEMSSLHHKAMDLAEDAFFLQKKGDVTGAVEKYKAAYGVERCIADYLKNKSDCEPSRSVIHRSAGWLALHAGYHEGARYCAEKTIEFGVLASEGQELLDELNKIIKDGDPN